MYTDQVMTMENMEDNRVWLPRDLIEKVDLWLSLDEVSSLCLFAELQVVGAKQIPGPLHKERDCLASREPQHRLRL